MLHEVFKNLLHLRILNRYLVTQIPICLYIGITFSVKVSSVDKFIYRVLRFQTTKWNIHFHWNILSMFLYTFFTVQPVWKTLQTYQLAKKTVVKIIFPSKTSLTETQRSLHFIIALKYVRCDNDWWLTNKNVMFFWLSFSLHHTRLSVFVRTNRHWVF